MDKELEQRIRERAFALWQADGCPEGRALDYWLAAEQDLTNLSFAGEEDPLEGLDRDMFEALAKRK